MKNDTFVLGIVNILFITGLEGAVGPAGSTGRLFLTIIC